MYMHIMLIVYLNAYFYMYRLLYMYINVYNKRLVPQHYLSFATCKLSVHMYILVF